MAPFLLAHLDAEGSPLLAPDTLATMHEPGLDSDDLGILAEGPWSASGPSTHDQRMVETMCPRRRKRSRFAS